MFILQKLTERHRPGTPLRGKFTSKHIFQQPHRTITMQIKKTQTEQISLIKKKPSFSTEGSDTINSNIKTNPVNI